MNDTTTATPGPSARSGAKLAALALGVGLVCGVAALLAGPSYRMEWLSLSSGLQTIRWAAIGSIAGAVVALVAWGLLARARVPGGRRVAVAAILLNALVASPPLYLYGKVQSVPHIHDVSTDTADPPGFVAAATARQGARNSTVYQPKTAAEQQRGYPDIVPLTLEIPPDEAFRRAERTARSMGWEILSAAPSDLRIEATATTLLFGFKDDIVIRIRPQARGSMVDMRSESRVGGSDFGVNAERIRTFMHKLATS